MSTAVRRVDDFVRAENIDVHSAGAVKVTARRLKIGYSCFIDDRVVIRKCYLTRTINFKRARATLNFENRHRFFLSYLKSRFSLRERRRPYLW